MVNKALLSASRLVKGGHGVVFDQGSSIADDTSGQRTWQMETWRGVRA